MSEILSREFYEHLLSNAFDTGNEARLLAHDAALRAALARETERAEKAERERDEARGVQIGMLKRTADRAERAESERDRLRERLDQFEAYGIPNVAAALDRIDAAESRLDALSHLGTGAGRRAG